MPIHLVWDNDDKTILRQVYDGQWTVDDFNEAVVRNVEIQATVSHPVDVITDLRHSTTQTRIMIAAVARHMERHVPPNQRLVIMVGADAFLKIIARISRTLAPRTAKNAHMVDTIEEAYAIIRQTAEERVS